MMMVLMIITLTKIITILTAAAMRTPEKGPRKAPNVAAMTRTYLVIVKMIIFDDYDYRHDNDNDDDG